MSDYSLFCTEEQTRRALELGAPIDNSSSQFDSDCTDNIELLSNGLYAIIPTAEQMIGWIESISTIQIHIEKQMLESGTQYRIWVREECKPFSNIIKMFSYSSRPEAALAAIDAALEYLEKQK